MGIRTGGRAGGRARRAAVATAVAGIVSAVGVVTAAPAWAPPPVLPGLTANGNTVDGNLHVTGTGIANDLHATRVDSTTVELDDIRPITVLGSCWHPKGSDATVARCTVAPVPDLNVNLGGGNDRITIHGGGSKWLVSMGPGDDTVDTVLGTANSAYYVGNEGNDTFVSGTAGEVFEGEDGFDTVSYAGTRSPSGPVTVDLAAEEGGNPSGEDWLQTIERVVGTTYGDTITGDGLANTLEGGSGPDTLSGGNGIDTLLGGTSDDSLFGNWGNDLLYGGLGFDALNGGQNSGDLCDLGGSNSNGGTKTQCEI